MRKEIKLLLSSLVVILLLAILLVVINNVFFKENTKELEQQEIHKEPKTKEKKLKSIKTPDKKITIAETTAYYREGISEVMLDISSINEYEDLYLTLEFKKDDILIDTIILHQKDILKNSKFKYLIQSEEDLTKTKDWYVNIVNYETVINTGYKE